MPWLGQQQRSHPMGAQQAQRGLTCRGSSSPPPLQAVPPGWECPAGRCGPGPRCSPCRAAQGGRVGGLNNGASATRSQVPSRTGYTGGEGMPIECATHIALRMQTPTRPTDTRGAEHRHEPQRPGAGSPAAAAAAHLEALDTCRHERPEHIAHGHLRQDGGGGRAGSGGAQRTARAVRRCTAAR